MPREVYLIPSSNAWVASRGGIMGIGSRRVMAVGIPLLQTLTISPFSAVLAHEFGHYRGGDVKLGPWIYKTRLAILRTVLGLIDKTSINFDVYWQEDVVPVLAKGFCPPGEEKEGESHVDAALRPAMTLLIKKAPEIELELIAWVQATQKLPLTPVSWPEVGQKVWREIWKEGADLFAIELVSPVTPADLPRLMQGEAALPQPAAARQGDFIPPEVSRIVRIVHKYGSALSNAMIRTGWNPEVLPGATVNLDKGGIRFSPFENIAKLARREMDEESWRELCRDAGISDLQIGR